MADTAPHTTPPKRLPYRTPTPPSGGGIFLPLPIVSALILAFAGLVATYVFATKIELAEHSNVETRRITTLEEGLRYQEATLDDLRTTVREIDKNVRALLVREGVKNP